MLVGREGRGISFDSYLSMVEVGNRVSAVRSHLKKFVLHNAARCIAVTVNLKHFTKFFMENKSLTPQELQTLNAYDTFLAKTRTTKHGDITFWQKQFHLFTSFLPSGTILDLGCGAGRDALLFATNTAYRYVGVDLSSKMLDEARKIAPEADFRQMNMYNLDFPD